MADSNQYQLVIFDPRSVLHTSAKLAKRSNNRQKVPKQPFRFLDLPSEIRVLIYRHVLVVPHCLHYQKKRVSRSVCKYGFQVQRNKVADRFAIMLANHQIYMESSTVFYTENVFEIIVGWMLAVARQFDFDDDKPSRHVFLPWHQQFWKCLGSTQPVEYGRWTLHPIWTAKFCLWNAASWKSGLARVLGKLDPTLMLAHRPQVARGVFQLESLPSTSMWISYPPPVPPRRFKFEFWIGQQCTTTGLVTLLG